MALTGTSLFLSFLCLRVFELSVENVRWGEQVHAQKGEDVSRLSISRVSPSPFLLTNTPRDCRLDLPLTDTAPSSKRTTMLKR